jgi:hypothetical protein
VTKPGAGAQRRHERGRAAGHGAGHGEAGRAPRRIRTASGAARRGFAIGQSRDVILEQSALAAQAPQFFRDAHRSGL